MNDVMTCPVGDFRLDKMISNFGYAKSDPLGALPPDPRSISSKMKKQCHA